MLNNLKQLLGISDNTKDALLTLLIQRAVEYAVNFTHNDNIATTCENTIMAMCIWEYNRLGTEGVNSENYSGVSFTYSADYPETLLRTLKACRKIVTI